MISFQILKNLLFILIAIFWLISCGDREHLPESGTSIIEQTSVEKSIYYDKAGRVLREEISNGRYIEYVYDNNGNIIEIRVNEGGGVKNE